MYCKVHESKYGIIVAACDDAVHGKTLKEGEIEFYINPRFYGKRKVSKKKVAQLLEHCYSANLVGKEAVDLGIELGLVDPKQVKKIKKVPHAIVVVIK